MKIFKYLFITFLCVGYLYSQPIIINEIYNSNSTDEWLELLVVQDSLDLRNWDIRDFSSSGSAQQPLVFSNQSVWSNLKKGTVIVVARSENTFSEDLDPSDYLLIVKSNNGQYFSGNVFLIAGSSEAVQIRNSSQTHIFGVSWGAANANSIPDPKVHFSNSASSNTSIYFNGDNISQVTSTANWTVNGSSSLGIGNTPVNSNWILSLRARVDGSGTATLSPQVALGDSLLDLIFNYIRVPEYNINKLKIVIPSDFNWSQDSAHVSITNFTASKLVSADTILFSNVNFSDDSVLISITGVTTPIFTGKYKFIFQSGIDSVISDVGPLPVLTVYGAPIPISQAKENDADGFGINLGDLVTVRGIVTVSNEFGSPSFIQDNSGGISIYGPSFSDTIKIGDEVLVSGTITQFNGLNQLESPILHSILSIGNSVDPMLVTPSMLANDGIAGVENYEGRLVRVNNVLVTDFNGSTVSNWAYDNYILTGANASDTVQIRIDNNTQIIGMVAPAGRFDVIGVLGQFKTSVPYIGAYQLMPRLTSDIISNGPIIEKFPEETELTSSSITLGWGTINPGTSRIRYGLTTDYELGTVEPDNDLTTDHSVTVTGLKVATIYNLQAFSEDNNSDTSFSGNIISSTTSEFPTTGEIDVYFNKSVNTSVSSGVDAIGNADFTDIVIQRINNAKRSIDVALYSLSGTVGANVASALVSAKNRGVKIRVVGEYDNRTTVPWSTLTVNGIPYINDAYGNNDGSGLSHNKFFIIDYRGGAPDSVWVITGSWNPTDPGTDDDRQNLVLIQDVALAGAYTVEFNEEWGSNTDTPNAQNSRFGSRKLNNTPHNFVIGNVKVQSYFSPSDGTTYQIGKTLSKTQSSINAAILTFTRRDLADTIIAVKNKNAKTRIILSNSTDTGSQFTYLQSHGVDIRLKGFTTGLLHHKYAIVDAEPLGLTPYVITGSHNWSSSAENSNDENTLIIQDDKVANLYLQEFAARYYEAGGTDSIKIIISDVENESEIPTHFSLYQNYPNPFNPVTTIKFAIPYKQKVTLVVYDVLGRKVKTLYNEVSPAGINSVKFNASNLSSGVYIYRFQAGSFVASRKLIVLK